MVPSAYSNGSPDVPWLGSNAAPCTFRNPEEGQMKNDFVALSYVSLQAGTTFLHPPDLPELVHLDSPATDVMTDFRFVRPVTVRPDIPIDKALLKMKSAGVRLLLVTDDERTITGVVTSKILLGEAPIQIVREKRVPRSAVTVAMVMVPQPEVPMLDMMSVRNAQVGHVVKTLQQLDRKHVLVAEIDPKTKQQRICGLFSTSQIGRQLGVTVIPETAAAQTLAEIQQQLGGT
jgi:signal-transduction protein with cAMP-binding, CBS, and nucleotidyltransferase domain